MTVTLKDLRKYKLVPKSTKRWTKDALAVKSEFIARFGARKPPQGLVWLKVSDVAKKALQSVNIDVMGNTLLFPAAGHKITVVETKRGVFVNAVNKQGTKYQIVLSKSGDHLKYAKSLKHKSGTVFGTLKESEYTVSGRRVKGYMRDLSALHESPDGAINDERYKKIDTSDASKWRQDRKEFIRDSEVTALIRFWL